MRGILAGAAVMLLAGCSVGTSLPAATTEVERFHRRLDAGQYAETYRDSGAELKAMTSEADWIKVLQFIHTRLGTFKSASAPGWFDGWKNGRHSIELTYESTYERGKAQEEFVFFLDGGRPVLVGYHALSKALAPDGPPPGDGNSSSDPTANVD